MKKLLFIASVGLLFSCSNGEPEITIGSQVWMSENLNVDKFSNGDPIPEAKTDEEWVEAGKNGKPAWCYFNNDPANGEKYGKLYNWYAVNDPRGLAPVGYHIPSHDEWRVLKDYLVEEEKPGPKMKSKEGWPNDENGWVGDNKINYNTNSSGFSALPGGFRSRQGSFDFIGHTGSWWSSTEDDAGYEGKYAFARHLRDGYITLYWESSPKVCGNSVRCIKD